MRFQLLATKLAVLIVLNAVLDASALRAADFRVDSKVFVGKEMAPHTTNMTLFHAAHVYDFLDKPRQITVYDLERGRIVLLDPERRVKAEVTAQMLDSFCESLRRADEKTEDELLRFALRPVFDERVGQESDERVFSSKYITYRVKMHRSDVQGAASQYRAFSDASARLNTLANRGSLPPFPRLAVNEALARTGDVPANLELKIAPRRAFGARAVVLRSEHDFRPRLLDSDLRKVDEAGELLSAATRVGLGEYLRPAVKAEE